MMNVKPLHAIITSHVGLVMVARSLATRKPTPRWHRNTNYVIYATMRSVLNRQHKEHKPIRSLTSKETTTRLLHHGKHRNWWTPPRNSNNLPTIWYEFDGMRSHPPSISNYHWLRQWLVAWPAPSHGLIQCLNIVDWTLGNKLQWNLNRNSYIFFQENKFEHVVSKMAVILSQPQCVNDAYKSLKLNELTVHQTLTFESATWLRPNSEIMSVTRAPRSASDLSRGKRRLAENRRFSRMVRVPMTTSSWN